MSDEIDKALAGLSKPELVLVVKVMMRNFIYAPSLARIVKGIKSRVLREKAEAAWQRYLDIQIPECNPLGPFLAAVKEKEAACAEYERLWKLADKIEFGTKMEDAR